MVKWRLITEKKIDIILNLEMVQQYFVFLICNQIIELRLLAKMKINKSSLIIWD